jgi:drug/metabolite transporter (DMT)-like permease
MQILPYLALLAASALWGGSFIAMKFALAAYDPMVVVLSRMIIAVLCFLPFAGMIRRGIRPEPGDGKRLAIMILCEPCLYFIFEANALVYTSAAQAGIIASAIPPMTVVAAAVFLKEHIGKAVALGLCLALIGSVWLSLVSPESSHAPDPILGNLLQFGANVCTLGYFINAKTLSQRFSPLSLTALQSIFGCLFFVPIVLSPLTTKPEAFSLSGSLAVIFLGVFVTIGAYGCYNYGQSKIPAGRASLSVNFIPVVALVTAWLILGETLSMAQSAASLLILLGVAISGKPKKPSR